MDFLEEAQALIEWGKGLDESAFCEKGTPLMLQAIANALIAIAERLTPVEKDEPQGFTACPLCGTRHDPLDNCA